MRPDDFFKQDGPGTTHVNMELLHALRRAPVEGVADLDAAYALARLTQDELEEFGTSGNQKLSNDEIAAAIRALLAVLKRLHIALALPFRDFKGFYGYWKREGMSGAGSWGARSGFINDLFTPVLARLEEIEDQAATGRSGRRARPESDRITGVTRRRLIDGFNKLCEHPEWNNPFDGVVAFETPWHGVLEQSEFAERLREGAGRLYWRSTWEDVLHPACDLSGSDDALLKLLTETLHPEVRPNADEVQLLVHFYNDVLAHDGFEIVQAGEVSGSPVFGHRRIGDGVTGAVRQLIFAADGPKPEIKLDDIVSNDIKITKYGEHCLVYDRPIGAAGLTWADLLLWWRERASFADEVPDIQVGHSLYQRLITSMVIEEKTSTGAVRKVPNKAERMVFDTYRTLYHGDDHPALVPQVYVHYDPLTRRQRGGADSVLGRERMDFLLLLPRGVRVVLEVDGKQHYADAAGKASAHLYAKMVAEDRSLRLKGYEVYRFGGWELANSSAVGILRKFFAELLGRHGVAASAK